jgi:apolipoprotein(a)
LLAPGRNPDGDIKPWCYPNITGHKTAYCDVPFCDGEIRVNNFLCGTLKERGQADYRGTINVTMTKKLCQRWDSQVPHTHQNTPEMAPLSGLEENYCRNPDGEGLAWCYTMDNGTRWEFCDVPICEVLYASETNRTSDDEVGIRVEAADNNSAVCGSAVVGQSDYRGTINVTESGRTCQHWDSKEPHHHSRTHENYPHHDLVENYCECE